MGRRNKVRMPSSEGGIVSYFDDEFKSKIMIEPKIVIFMVVAISVIAIALRMI
jgi:preprotein translocase subunit Sec61beta